MYSFLTIDCALHVSNLYVFLFLRVNKLIVIDYIIVTDEFEDFLNKIYHCPPISYQNGNNEIRAQGES